MTDAAHPLTFDDLVALLRGERPLPDNRCLAFGLPLSAGQLGELVPLLQDNEALRGLKLRGCRLDDEAAEALSRGLAFNARLRYLDLRDNSIGGSGALYLANALRTFNHTLLTLDLGGNPAVLENPETMQEIALFLHRNSTQDADTPPATSPTSGAGAALVRFQEVHPSTPAGRTAITMPDAELERRLQELEQGQAAARTQAAALAESGASFAEYRASLDVASQQMALVLEMLKKDVEAVKAQLAEEAREGASGGSAGLQRQLADTQAALACLQQRFDGSSQQAASEREGLGLLMDAVQMMEGKLGKLEAGGASRAQQAQQAELKRQVALATEAASKAGGEAQAVAAGMKSVGASIRALQAEVATNTASFAGAQGQAEGAANAVAALEEQMRTLQLSLDAMEQALDGADVGRRLGELQARVAAQAAEQDAYAAASTQQASQLLASVQALQGRQGRADDQLAALADARLAERADRLEQTQAKLEAVACQQAAAISHLAPAAALEELRESSGAALQAAVASLSGEQAAHAAAVASQLAALPPPFDDGPLRARVTAAEAALEQGREALAALKGHELQQLRSEVQAQLAAVHERQAAAAEQAERAAMAATEAGGRAAAGQADLKAALEGQAVQMAAGLAEAQAAMAAIPAYDDAPLRAEAARQVADAQADVRRLRQEAEEAQAALAEQLTGLGAALEAVRSSQAAAEGRAASAADLQQAQEAADAQWARLAAQLAVLEEQQTNSADGQSRAAAEVEQLRLSAQQAAAAVGELRAGEGRLEGALQQLTAVQQQSCGAQGELEGRVAAAEGQLLASAHQLALLEARARPADDDAASVPAAALAELQQQCEQLGAVVLEQAAAAQAGLAELASGFEQHRAAVLGQCSELQEGLEAVPHYDDRPLLGRLQRVEQAVQRAEQELGGKAPAAALAAAAAELRGELQAGQAAATEGAAAVARDTAAQLAGLRASVAMAARQLDGLQPAAAIQGLREDAQRSAAATTEQLAELWAALKAVKVSAGQQEEQLAQLEAAAQGLAPASAVQQLQATVEAQQGAVARQLGELLANIKSAAEGQQERLGGLGAALADAQRTIAALQPAGITSAVAAVLCQEAVRPLEQLLAAAQAEQGAQAAAGSKAVAQLQRRVDGLQAALAASQQEHACLAGTVGDMRGSALAVAAAVADRQRLLLPAATPAPGASLRAPSPVPSLPLGLARSTGSPGAAHLASFPLVDCTLDADGESDGEQGRGCGAAAPPAALAGLTSVDARLVVLAKQNARLEGVVHRQEQSIHQLEAELLCIKRLLTGGSPLVAGRPGAVATTPASHQHFFDAESVLGEPSPAATSRPPRLAGTPAGGSAARPPLPGSRLAVADAATLGSLESQFRAAAGSRAGSAGFGSDLTNTGAAAAGGKAGAAPAAAPARGVAQ